jgi:O-antigen ligase
VGLFALERDRAAKLSWAVWIPTIWLFISGSRHISEWINGLGGAMSEQQYLEGSPLDAGVYGLLILAAVIVLAGRKHRVAKVLHNNLPIVIFVLYCAISIVWSDYPGVAFKRCIKSLGDYTTILILLTEKDPGAAVRSALARVSFVVFPISILFIKYYPELGRSYASHWVGTQYFVGICDNKNMLGMVCMIFGFASVCRLLQILRGPRRERRKGSIVHVTMVAMAVWVLLLSDSKTSLACFVLTVGLVFAHTYFKAARQRVIVCLSVAFVIGCSFSVLFLGIGSGALNNLGRNSTLTGRTEIWAALLTVHINPVLGTGFESFWLGERLTYLWTFPIVNGITEAHNGYLEMYLNLGIVGVALLAVLIWTGFRNVLRLLERNPDEGRLRLGYFVIAMIYNFTEAGFRSTDLIWIGFILAVTSLPKQLHLRERRVVPLREMTPPEGAPVAWLN